ncbi:pyridoxal 5'-phosphate synthase glutaminase subunit PdxT [Nocardioides alcanivorans]|uniref:pyridoxal 5'-phosphate synthase glutaminase subunit PdxT n=1 Tax=Nocardioides alcanivorans TaxID=2897352 RepID=UPI001F2389A9|nr:pyridoxal 5'-phosphate synthase glutaminase subunit PdxT [Nocardioides alcanivorans]
MTSIGVFALQGDVREHLQALQSLGVETFGVRRLEELERCDGLIIPGGESTTMWKLARTFGLAEPIRRRIAEGLPVFGTCAGMIMLADRIVDAASDQETFGGLDVTVRRNAFGRQVDSFETVLDVAGVPQPVPAVFIRAPWVEEAGPEVEVLARVGADPAYGAAVGRIVAVRQGRRMATSFHPEIGDDPWLHRLFVDMVVAAEAEVPGPHRN